jgi:thiamine biosynthesis protein ThiS
MESAAASQTQSILVNGEPQEIPEGCTVLSLLAGLDMGDRRVAVALNRSVVPRSSYADVTVGSGDHVEILEAVGGG